MLLDSGSELSQKDRILNSETVTSHSSSWDGRVVCYVTRWWKKTVLLDSAIKNLMSATSQDLLTPQAPSDSDFPTAAELVARNCEKFYKFLDWL